MNRIEERLSRAIEDAPSVSVEELKRADVQKMKEHDDITMQEKGVSRLLRLDLGEVSPSWDIE